MSEWERGGPRAVETAIEIINGRQSKQDGPPMRG